jgi:hypothetical protein
LPTQPEKQWPEEWLRYGGYPGFLDPEFVRIEPHWVSAEAARRTLGIGHSVWKRLVADLKPAGSVAHKMFYDPSVLGDHLLSVADSRMRRADAVRLASQIGSLCAT